MNPKLGNGNRFHSTTETCHNNFKSWTKLNNNKSPKGCTKKRITVTAKSSSRLLKDRSSEVDRNPFQSMLTNNFSCSPIKERCCQNSESNSVYQSSATIRTLQLPKNVDRSRSQSIRPTNFSIYLNKGKFCQNFEAQNSTDIVKQINPDRKFSGLNSVFPCSLS